jgi:PAS domain S-box-containing protein
MMGLRLKTKLTLGLVFLFVVILAFGILGLFYINRLSSDERMILKDNYITLEYCNNMLKTLEELPGDTAAIRVFNANLVKQEANITESGELEATQSVRKYFEAMKHSPGDTSSYKNMRRAIFVIQDLNQLAIIRKDKKASVTATSANLWLTIIVTILTIVAFTFIVNFPGIISEPIKALADGIAEIAGKNYSKRIHVAQDDEFGDLARAFNSMAEKLDEYDHSNLAQIMFEKTRIETIINQMKDGIIGFDEHRNVLFANVVSENLFGLKEKDLVGRYAADIAVQNDLMRTLLQNDGKKEMKIYCDGKEGYFSKEPITVRKDNQVIGEVIVMRNITPFHELDEAKTNFIATVSHELKTPISSIKMSARLLQDKRIGILSPEQAGYLQSITDDAERLLRITGELLNMTQVETGNIELKLQRTPPGEVVKYACDAVQVQARQKDIRIQKDLQFPLPAIHADGEKVVWVLINLLTNALKYSPENAVIDVSVYASDQWVFFSVKDHGRGIEEKYLPRVFERYFRVPGSSEKTGTGLGLAISKEFIEAQGGRIWVKSSFGSGAEFGFCLKSEVI